MSDQDVKPDQTGKRRHRAYLLYSVLAAVTFFMVVLAVLVLWPFKYEAQVDVLVRINRDAAAAPQIGGGVADQIVVTGVRFEDVATEIAILTGRGVAEQAYETLGPEFFVEEKKTPENFRQRIIFFVKDILKTTTDALEAGLVKLKLAKTLSDKEEAINDLMDGLNVSKSVRSDMISVRFRWTSPEGAARVLSAITTAYHAAHQAAREAFRGQEMFTRLHADTKAELERMSAEIEKREASSDVYDPSLWIDQITRITADLERELATVMRKIAQVREQLALAEAERATLQASALSDQPLNTSEVLAEYSKKLLLLREDMARDSRRFGRDAEQVRETAGIIEVLQQDMRTVDLAQSDRLIRSLKNELAILDVRATGLEDDIRNRRERLGEVSRGEAELRILETRRAAIEQSFAQLSAELARSRWLSELDKRGAGSVTILDPLTVSDAPVAPNKVLILIVAILLSIMLGTGLSLAMHRWSDIRAWAGSPLRSRNDNDPQTPVKPRVLHDSPEDLKNVVGKA